MLVVLLSALPGFAADPYGLWETQKTKRGSYLHVNVTACRKNPERLCGYINETFKTKHTQIVGRALFWGMRDAGDGTWKGGKVWVAYQNKTYAGRVKMRGNALRVEGCLGPICDGQNWSRVK